MGDIARVPPRVHADTPLDVAVDAIAESGEDGLPILAADGDAVVGWITQRDALSAYRSRPGAGQSNASRPAPAPSSPQPAPR